MQDLSFPHLKEKGMTWELAFVFDGCQLDPRYAKITYCSTHLANRVTILDTVALSICGNSTGRITLLQNKMRLNLPSHSTLIDDTGKPSFDLVDDTDS
jgi:hypothetical protein